MAGRCTRPGGCAAECQFSTIKMFCEHFDTSHPAGEHAAKQIAAWKSLPEVSRKLALDHLRMSLTHATGQGGREALAKWKAQKAAGIEIGSDDCRFHFSGGMAVRNILRQVCADPGGNWDDYYYGALDELAGET